MLQRVYFSSHAAYSAGQDSMICNIVPDHRTAFRPLLEFLYVSWMELQIAIGNDREDE
jgi:hypothetical protein